MRKSKNESTHRPQSKDGRENQDRSEDRGEVQGVEEREGSGVGWEIRGLNNLFDALLIALKEIRQVPYKQSRMPWGSSWLDKRAV